MDKQGKLIFGAITVSAANIIGAHLSYIGLNAPEMLPAATARQAAVGPAGCDNCLAVL